MYKYLSIVVLIIIFSLTVFSKSSATSANTPSWHLPTIATVLAYSQPTTTGSLTPVQSYIMHQINQYRASLGLSPVQPSDQTCAFADMRAKEIATDFSHAGFTQRYEAHTIPYTYWSYITENLAEAPDYREVVRLWENSPTHDTNLRANTPYICVMQYHDYYAFEGMRP